MPNCVIKGCRNHASKFKKCHGISYHRFPNDPIRSDIWSRIVRKQRKDPYFKPHRDARICSAHFLEKHFDISKSGKRKLNGWAIPQLEVEDRECRDSKEHQPTPNVDAAQYSQITDFKVEVEDRECRDSKEHQPTPNVDAAQYSQITDFKVEVEVCENEEHQPQPNVDEAKCSQMEEIDVDISDLDYIFDTPITIKLKRRIAKLEQRQKVTSTKIKTLQTQNARLKKKNRSLLDMIEDLKRKN